MKKQSHHLIELFGGIRPMARALRIPPTTVQWWQESGFIPPRYYKEILANGRAAGVSVTPSDFVAYLN